MRASRGFTLIEVMITIAIVAILAAIALPSYTAYIMRANVTDAIKGLSEMRLKMEQYFLDNRSWTPGGVVVAPCTNGGIAPLPQNTERFTFECTTPDATHYVIKARGKVGSRMDGFLYSINEANVQATEATPNGSGWPTCASRWVLKAGDTCT